MGMGDTSLESKNIFGESYHLVPLEITRRITPFLIVKVMTITFWNAPVKVQVKFTMMLYFVSMVH